MSDTPPFLSPDRQWSTCGGIAHIATPIPLDQTPPALTTKILSALSKNDFQSEGWYTPNFGIKFLFFFMAPKFRAVFGYDGDFDLYRDLLPPMYEYHILGDKGYLYPLLASAWKVHQVESSTCQIVVTLTSNNRTCRLIWDLLYQPYSFSPSGTSWKISHISLS